MSPVDSGIFHQSVPIKKGEIGSIKSNLFVLAFVHAFFAYISGCATVRVTPAEKFSGQRFAGEGKLVAHVYVANYGYYLFKYIPLVAGNFNKPTAVQRPLFFRDSVQQDLIIQKRMEQSKELGATPVSDLRTTDKSKWLSWSLILWMNEIEFSANVSNTN